MVIEGLHYSQTNVVKFVDLGGFAGWMQVRLREASAEQGNPAL